MLIGNDVYVNWMYLESQITREVDPREQPQHLWSRRKGAEPQGATTTPKCRNKRSRAPGSNHNTSGAEAKGAEPQGATKILKELGKKNRGPGSNHNTEGTGTKKSRAPGSNYNN